MVILQQPIITLWDILHLESTESSRSVNFDRRFHPGFVIFSVSYPTSSITLGLQLFHHHSTLLGHLDLCHPPIQFPFGSESILPKLQAHLVPIDQSGIHATRVVSGRRFVRWDTVPKLLAQQNAYITALPYEFFFAKTGTNTSSTTLSHDYPREDEDPFNATTADVDNNNGAPDPFSPSGLTPSGPPNPSGASFTSTSSSSGTRQDSQGLNLDPSLIPTLISQLHAQPLNINILSWKKQTIEHILDGLDKARIRVASRPQGRDVVFELCVPGMSGVVDVPRWPEAYPSMDYSAFPHHAQAASTGSGPGPGPIRNSRPERERRRKLSTTTNASNTTGSTGSEITTSSWSGGSEQKHEVAGYSRPSPGYRGDPDYPVVDAQYRHAYEPDGFKRSSTSEPVVVHNHTLTPFRPYQEQPHAQSQAQGMINHAHGQAHNDRNYFHREVPPPQQQHISQPLPSPSSTHPNAALTMPANAPGTGGTGTGGTFLTTPTPTKKWTRRSSPDRIFMNMTLNGILRSAGMPIPRQKDDASRLPWSSIPQFLAENKLYITGWPEANLPWLYSGDGIKGAGGGGGGGGAGANGAAPGATTTTGIGEWRDRIDWKSSPSQRSYKPLAQALRSGDIQIVPRPPGREVLFEVRDAQGRSYDSTLGLSDEWKAKWMQDTVHGGGGPSSGQQASASTPGSGSGSSPGSGIRFVNTSPQRAQGARHRQHQRQPLDMHILEEELERGRPGYHSRSASRSAMMDLELPSPTETTASSSSGTTRRQGHHHVSPRHYPSVNNAPSSQPAFPGMPLPHRVSYQNLGFHPEQPKHSHSQPPLPHSYSSSFPPNYYHDAPRRLTPPIDVSDRDGPPSSSIRFSQPVNRQYPELPGRFQRPSALLAESDSRRNTPSPDSSQRQRTVSLGTSSASTGTGTVLSGSSSGFSTAALSGRGGSGRYNLPSLSQGAMDVDMDMDDPNHNRLPPIMLRTDAEPEHGLLPFPIASLKRTISDSALPPAPRSPTMPFSHPSHFPSPVVAFSQPLWSALEKTWKLSVLDPVRASLPPLGDTILWDADRRSWKLVWAADADASRGSSGARTPTAVWSAGQEAWILES